MSSTNGTRGSRASLSLAVAAVVLALGGCAGAPAGGAEGELSGPPEPEPSVFVGDSISGVGPTGYPGVDLPLAPDARSVVLSFACAGGERFSVELGDSMMLGQSPLSGTCDGESELGWPITDETGPTLSVFVADGVEWMVTPRFSADEFAFDAALTSECERFSVIYSALLNADTGYTQYGAFDAAEWTSRVDGASAQLEALVREARSPLSDAYEELAAAVARRSPVIGSVLTAASAQHIAVIGDACAANQTPLVLQAEFGG